MHTAVCTFEDRDAAERAVQRLLNAGFSRRDVHLQDRDEPAPVTAPVSRERWAGMEHEIAFSADALRAVGDFFGNLFGRGHPHHEAYTRHVNTGRVVIVVDALDEPEADRARSLMQDLKAEHLDVVHRPTQRPLRDLLSRSPAHVESPEAVQAAAHGRSTDWAERGTPVRPEERAFAQGSPMDRTVSQEERDRASAQSAVEQRTFDFGEVGRGSSDASRSSTPRSDLDKVGLRYSDKDKPGK